MFGMHKYRVYKNELTTRTSRFLTLICEEGERPLLYEPGQYAAISLHDKSRPTATRCFSIASSPAQQRTLQFGIRVGGKYTRALERLKEGDIVTIRGPFGRFVLNSHIDEDLVLFAGGIGISPFMSMLRYANDLHLKNKIHLVYSCRNQEDIPFFEELTQLERDNPYLKITYTITDGVQDRLNGAHVISGRLNKSNFGELGIGGDSETYMICGPRLYMKAMKTLLTYNGVPKNRILSEAFSQGSGSQSEKLARWPGNAYVLAGLSLLISGIFVIAVDINKTLPVFDVSKTPDVQLMGNTISADGNIDAKINSLGPQVDTDLSPKNIIQYVTDENQTVVNPAPTPVPTPIPTPTVVKQSKPKTVTPISRPKTKVS